jgi:hypothetical protein
MSNQLITLTFDISADSKVYDATTSLDVNKISISNVQGIASPDDVQVIATSASFDDKNVGENKNLNVQLGLSGTDANKYSIDSSANISGTITAKSLDFAVTAGSPTIPYAFLDFLSDIDFYSFTPDVIEGDDVAVEVSSPVYDSATGNLQITVYFQPLTGEDSGNYTIAEKYTNITVVKSHATNPKLAGLDFSFLNKTFDGVTQLNRGSNQQVNNILNQILNMDIEFEVSYGIHTRNATGVISNVDGISYPLSTGDVNVYTYFGSQEFTTGDLYLPAYISPKPLIVNVSANDKVYDGTTGASANVDISSGIIDSFNQVGIQVDSAYFDDASVGNNKKVMVSFSLTGYDKDFYTTNPLSPVERSASITSSNQPPTDISLNSLSINENNAVGDVIGTFSTTDPDADNTFTYSLVGGTGSADNTSFTITSYQLLANEVFDYETKSSYYIRVRSTDQDGESVEKQFTITVNNVSEATTTIVITDGKVPSSILSLSSESSFSFTDPQTTYTQSAKIFTGTGSDLPLGNLTDSGPQVKILSASSSYKFIFSSYSTSTQQIIGGTIATKDFAFVLKVVDLSENVKGVLSPPLNIEIYLDSSGGTIVNLDVDGQPAGSGTLNRDKVGEKYKYSCTLTRGDGAVTGSLSTPTPSSGSDPHITTIFGKKYDFHPSTRRNYTLYKSKEIKVTSHFTGFKQGVFYDKVMIDLPNKEKMEVDFNKSKIKGKSSQVSVCEQSLPIKYKNHTYNKSVGNEFKPKSLTKLSCPRIIWIDCRRSYSTRLIILSKDFEN